MFRTPSNTAHARSRAGRRDSRARSRQESRGQSLLQPGALVPLEYRDQARHHLQGIAAVEPQGRLLETDGRDCGNPVCVVLPLFLLGRLRRRTVTRRLSRRRSHPPRFIDILQSLFRVTVLRGGLSCSRGAALCVPRCVFPAPKLAFLCATGPNLFSSPTCLFLSSLFSVPGARCAAFPRARSAASHHSLLPGPPSYRRRHHHLHHLSHHGSSRHQGTRRPLRHSHCPLDYARKGESFPLFSLSNRCPFRPYTP